MIAHLPFALILLTVLASPSLAQQRVQDFFNPTIRDFRLDFCRNWGTACGQPAADLFCREMGFERAASWQPSGPVGTQTLVFGDGRLCSGRLCSSFSVIRCSIGQPAPSPPVIAVPSPPKLDEKPSQPAETKPATIRPAPEKNMGSDPARRFTAVPRPRPPRAILKPPVQEPLAAVTITRPPDIGLFRIPDFSAERVTVEWLDTLAHVDTYPEGAALFQCAVSDCGVAISADFEVDPNAADQTVRFNWAVNKVPYAGGALWQVSYFPFPSFGNGSKEDLEPRGLVFSGRANTTSGFFSFDVRALAEKLPANATAAIFHVRILPASAVGFGQIVGQPSNVMRIYYGAEPPQAPPFQFYEPEVIAEAPPVELISLEFRPHKTVQWPPGCVDWETYKKSLKKNFFEKVGKAFKSAWNFASEGYQWAKNRVVDIAGALTFGAVPDRVLSFALDTALASAGIPPDIPNLDEMISGGLDHLAAEMAKTAVSQIPAADVSVSLNNLVAEITVDAALAMGEEAARERLQDELEKRSREALVLAVEEMQDAVTKDRKKVPCSGRFVPASYHVTVVNTGPERLEDISVGMADTLQIYEPMSEQVSLKPGQPLSFVRVPDPKLRDVWDPRLVRMEPTATNENIGHWWNEFLLKQETSIVISLPGQTECLGNCIATTREVHRSPMQRLDLPYEWAP